MVERASVLEHDARVRTMTEIDYAEHKPVDTLAEPHGSLPSLLAAPLSPCQPPRALLNF